MLVGDKKKVLQEKYKELKRFETLSSQFGDARPLSCCGFAPDSKYFATSGWGGGIKLWDVKGHSEKMFLRGHKERVSGLDFYPGVQVDQKTGLGMVSCSVDGSCYLWSFSQ